MVNPLADVGGSVVVGAAAAVVGDGAPVVADDAPVVAVVAPVVGLLLLLLLLLLPHAVAARPLAMRTAAIARLLVIRKVPPVGVAGAPNLDNPTETPVTAV